MAIPIDTSVWLSMVAFATALAVPSVTFWWQSRNLRIEKETDAAIRRDEKDADSVRARRERAEDQAAARELLNNTAKTADAAIATAVKLDEVHVLVNSNYTASLQATYEALQAKLVVLLDSVAFKKDHDIDPAPDVLADIETTKTKIAELRATIDDRLSKDRTAFEQKKNSSPALARDTIKPVPVTDVRATVAVEQTAIEAKRSADAQVRVADIAERVADKADAAERSADKIATPEKDK